MEVEIQELGEADISRAANVRRQINKIVKQLGASDFDLSDLLFETDTKQYFNGWGFDSFHKWAQSLADINPGFKYTKAYYLLAIKKTMAKVGLERNEYEPVGKTKLRVISELSKNDGLDKEFEGTPMVLLVRDLTLKAKEMTPEEVRAEVDRLKGMTAEESMVWMNIRVKVLAKENVIIPALRKAKRFMGQQKDEQTGEFSDASDGAALEMICANFLTDPNYDVEEDEQPTTNTPIEVSEAEIANTLETATDNL